MAVNYRKPGTIEAIIYWEDKRGHIILMNSSEMLGMQRLKRYMSKLGYEMRAAETLQQADKLQTKLQGQLKREQEFELAQDEARTAKHREQVRSRLEARKNSASCNDYEKEFIRLYLEYRNNKHEIFKRKFTQQVGHLDALEFDNPDQRLHTMLEKT